MAKKAHAICKDSKTTPGPWLWYGNMHRKDLILTTSHSGMLTILDALRGGRDGSMVRFRDDEECRMYPGEALALQPDHNETYHAVDNPDARLIASAPDLLVMCMKLTSFIACNVSSKNEEAQALHGDAMRLIKNIG